MFFDAFVSYENIIVEVAKDGFEGDGSGEEEEYAATNLLTNNSVSCNVSLNSTICTTRIVDGRIS